MDLALSLVETETFMAHRSIQNAIYACGNKLFSIVGYRPCFFLLTVHQQTTKLHPDRLISSLSLSAGYTIPQEENEVFSGVTICLCECHSTSLQSYRRRQSLKKKKNLDFNSWNSFLLTAGLKA